MLIDPFTVFAQVLNFVILVLILKRFLFGPIMRAIATREQKITAAQDKAKANQEQTLRQLQKIEAREAKLPAQEREFLRQAKSRAEMLEAKLINAAKTTARTKQEQLREALAREKIQRLDDLRRELAANVYKAVDQVLQDVAGQPLQERMEECFFDKLEHEPEKKFVALFSNGSSITVSTATPLDDQKRDRLHVLLAKKFGFQETISFEENKNLVAGIEISSNGRKITWTIETYLKDLKNGLLDQEYST